MAFNANLPSQNEKTALHDFHAFDDASSCSAHHTSSGVNKRITTKRIKPKAYLQSERQSERLIYALFCAHFIAIMYNRINGFKGDNEIETADQ